MERGCVALESESKCLMEGAAVEVEWVVEVGALEDLALDLHVVDR